MKAELFFVIFSKEPDSASDAGVLWSGFRIQLSGESLTWGHRWKYFLLQELTSTMKITIRNIYPRPQKIRGHRVAWPKKQNSLRQMRLFRLTSIGFLPGSKHLLGKTMSSYRGKGEEPVILVMKLLSDMIKTCPYQPYQLLANVRLWPCPFYQLPEFYLDHAQNQLFFWMSSDMFTSV